jgi:hypothetical protein
MKKIFAIAVLALAMVSSAFAGTFLDPNGATSFTQNNSGVLATNLTNTTQDVRFVQPGLELNLVLAPYSSQQVGSNSYGFYEWTCPSPYVTVIQGTNTMPTYDTHNTSMNCR